MCVASANRRDLSGYSSGRYFDLRKNSLVIRYYLEREPVDFDYESLEVVATNVTALIGAHSIPHIKIECEYASKPIGELECLGEFVYSRREYDMEDFIK